MKKTYFSGKSPIPSLLHYQILMGKENEQQEQEGPMGLNTSSNTTSTPSNGRAAPVFPPQTYTLPPPTTQQSLNTAQLETGEDDDQTLTFRIAIEGAITGAELMRRLEMQIYGQIIDSEWTSQGVPIAPDQVYGTEGQTINYSVTVLESRYRRLRSGTEEGAGVEVTEEGTVPSADARAQQLLSLDPGTRAALEGEILRRFQQVTGETERTEENEGIWNVLRDEVLAQHERAANLSDKVKLVIKPVEEGGTVIPPQQYPQLMRLIEQIEGLHQIAVEEYASRVGGTTQSLDILEADLQQFLEGEELRATEREDRTGIENRLFGSESLYDDLDEAETSELQERAQALGFDNLDDYQQHIDDYLASFHREAVRTGVILLQKYENLLYQEEQHYLGSDDARELGQNIQDSNAADLYDQADDRRSHARSVSMGFDPKEHIYAPENVAYRDGVRAEARQLEDSGDAEVQQFNTDHPLLQSGALDLRELSEQSPEETRAYLLGFIAEQREKIADTKERIQSDEDFVFKLDNLMRYMYQQEGITTGSVQDKVIQERIQSIQREEMWISIGIALLAIGLGLLSGGTGTVAVVAAVGGVAVSAYDVAREYGKYAEEQDAHDVGLLSQDPNFAWVLLALGGGAFDAVSMVKVVRSLKAPIETFEGLAKSDPARALAELEESLTRIDELDEIIQANIMRRAQYRTEFFQNIRSMNVVGMEIVPGSRALFEVATYAVKDGITRVEDFFALLTKNGLERRLGDLSANEIVVLRETLEQATALERLKQGVSSVPYLNQYENAPLADLIGTGQDKVTYALGSDRVISVVQNGDPQVLVNEIRYMEQLQSYNLPTGRILGVTLVENQPAMIMTRYAGSWKPTAFGSRDVDLFNVNTINSLQEMRRIIEQERLFIDDLQFLIRSDGRVVIADPLGVSANSLTPSLRVVDTAIEDAVTQVIQSGMRSGTHYSQSQLYQLLNNSVDASFFDDYLQMASDSRVGFLLRNGDQYTLK